MICPKCGAYYSDTEFKFCSSCGSKLIEEATPLEEPQKEAPVQTITKAVPNEKCVLLLVASIIGLAYTLYLLVYFMRMNGSAQNAGEAIGYGIASILVMPHLVCNVIAVIFNFIGWAKSKPSFALTAGILYSVSAFLFIIYIMFVAAQAVLCFVGYAKLKKQAA